MSRLTATLGLLLLDTTNALAQGTAPDADAMDGAFGSVMGTSLVASAGLLVALLAAAGVVAAIWWPRNRFDG